LCAKPPLLPGTGSQKSSGAVGAAEKRLAPEVVEQARSRTPPIDHAAAGDAETNMWINLIHQAALAAWAWQRICLSRSLQGFVPFCGDFFWLNRARGPLRGYLQSRHKGSYSRKIMAACAGSDFFAAIRKAWRCHANGGAQQRSQTVSWGQLLICRLQNRQRLREPKKELAS